MNLNQITAKSTLKELQEFTFKGENEAIQKLIKILCFSQFFTVEVQKICRN